MFDGRGMSHAVVAAASQAVPGPAVLAPEIQWRDDCHRVLNDPSVVNRYAFNSFHQYLEYCVEKKSKGEQLPWVREVHARSVRPARYLKATS